jgi:hypothetical protein
MNGGEGSTETMLQRKVESAKDDPQQHGKSDVGTDDPHQQLENDEVVRAK